MCNDSGDQWGTGRRCCAVQRVTEAERGPWSGAGATVAAWYFLQILGKMDTGNDRYPVTRLGVSMTDEQQTAEERAEAAARDLADTGRAVTARAVRETAGVRMTVAATVAKAWNDAASEDTSVPVPDVPADVQGRLEAIWADAYRAALDAAAPERDRLQLEVEHLTKDVQAYIDDLQDAEQTETALRAEIDQANQHATKAQADADAAVTQAHQEAAVVRGRGEQLAAENERLNKLIDQRLSNLGGKEYHQ